MHDPFFYSPFNISISNTISDQTSIELIADFSNNKQVVFNQFLGNFIDNKPVDYNVLIYTNNGWLRTINMTSTLRNNMQLVFRGNILEGLQQSNIFEIRKNENWNGSVTTDF